MIQDVLAGYAEYKKSNSCSDSELANRLGVSTSSLERYLRIKKNGGDVGKHIEVEERLKLLLLCEEAIQEQRIACTFDWLTIRFHCFSYNHACVIQDWLIHDVLGLDASLFTEEEKGLYGYARTIQFEDIRIMMAPQSQIETLGVLMMLSGGGCAQVYGLFQSQGLTFRDFLIRVCDRPHTITRIDIAVDDECKLLDLKEVFYKIQAEEYDSSFRKINPLYTYRIGNDEDGKRRQEIKGISIYFGSRKSPFFMCWYEKDEEQKAKLGKAGDDLAGYGNRYELRFCDDKAKELMINYLQADEKTTLLDIAMNRIRASVNFFEDTVSEKLWWRWSLFLYCAGKVEFKQVKDHDNEYIKKINWLRFYVMKSWQCIAAVCQYNADASLSDMMREVVLGRREVTFFRRYINDELSEEAAVDVLRSFGYQVSLEETEEEMEEINDEMDWEEG